MADYVPEGNINAPNSITLLDILKTFNSITGKEFSTRWQNVNDLLSPNIEPNFDHCLPTPRNSYNFTTWNAWVNSTYQKVIDTWTPLKGAGTGLSATYDSGDGIHPNTAGHTLIAQTVLTSISTIV